jgi:hypothetical protein
MLREIFIRGTDVAERKEFRELLRLHTISSLDGNLTGASDTQLLRAECGLTNEQSIP